MQMPSGDFNSQMTPGDIQKASFVTRLYGTHNQRGPYMYPQSPYALVGLGDIVPMAAMQPIDEETLFTNLPTQSPLGTSSAPWDPLGFRLSRRLPQALRGRCWVLPVVRFPS